MQFTKKDNNSLQGITFIIELIHLTISDSIFLK